MGLKQRHSNCCQFVRIMSQVAHPFILFNFMDYTHTLRCCTPLQSIHHHYSPPHQSCLHQSELHLSPPSFSLRLLSSSLSVIYMEKSPFNTIQYTPIFWGLTTHPWLRVAQVPLNKGHAVWWFPPVYFCEVPLHVRIDKGHPQVSYKI